MTSNFARRSMRTALSWLASWRERLTFYWHVHWHVRDKGNLLFFASLPLPFLLLGGLVVLAHDDYGRIEANRQRRIELTCLAENVYYEARGEPLAGQYAVAEVTMNRVASPLFPGTICDVVHEKRWDSIRKRYVGAFSWTEFESNRLPRGAAWRQARSVAKAVYGGEHKPVVEGALFYHAKNKKPSWARRKRPVATIGRHVFYR